MNSIFKTLQKAKTKKCLVKKQEITKKARTEGDNIQNYEKELEKRRQSLLNKMVYKYDTKIDSEYKKMKHNNSIAYMDSFNLENYQTKLLQIMSNFVDLNKIMCLKRNLASINENKNRVCLHPYYHLARNLECKVPSHLTKKLYSIGLKYKS